MAQYLLKCVIFIYEYKALRKAFSVILLILFSYNLIGYYLIFKLQHFQVRKEIKHKIKQSVPAEDLVIIKIFEFESHRLYWTKAEKEFKFQGQMYDVVKKEYGDNFTTFFCIHDFKDSHLFAQLDHHTDQYLSNSTEHKAQSQKLFRLWFKNYWFNRISLEKPFETPLNRKRFKKTSQYQSIHIDLLKPPPQTV